MKRLILSVLLLCACALTSTSAQSNTGIFPNPPQCSGCFVAASSDTHAPGSTITGSVTISGWAAVCNSGALVSSVTATALVNGVPTSVAVVASNNGHRPDVGAHLAANGCAQQDYAGIAFSFPNGFPTGTTAVSVQLWNQQIHRYFIYLVQ